MDNQRLDRYTRSAGKKRIGKMEKKPAPTVLHLTYGARDKRADCARLGSSYNRGSKTE